MIPHKSDSNKNKRSSSLQALEREQTRSVKTTSGRNMSNRSEFTRKNITCIGMEVQSIETKNKNSLKYLKSVNDQFKTLGLKNKMKKPKCLDDPSKNSIKIKQTNLSTATSKFPKNKTKIEKNMKNAMNKCETKMKKLKVKKTTKTKSLKKILGEDIFSSIIKFDKKRVNPLSQFIQRSCKSVMLQNSQKFLKENYYKINHSKKHKNKEKSFSLFQIEAKRKNRRESQKSEANISHIKQQLSHLYFKKPKQKQSQQIMRDLQVNNENSIQEVFSSVTDIQNILKKKGSVYEDIQSQKQQEILKIKEQKKHIMQQLLKLQFQCQKLHQEKKILLEKSNIQQNVNNQNIKKQKEHLLNEIKKVQTKQLAFELQYQKIQKQNLQLKQQIKRFDQNKQKYEKVFCKYEKQISNLQAKLSNSLEKNKQKDKKICELIMEKKKIKQNSKLILDFVRKQIEEKENNTKSSDSVQEFQNQNMKEWTFQKYHFRNLTPKGIRNI